MTDTKEAQEPKPEPVFAHETCLYRAGAKDAAEAEARVFRKGEKVPPKADGWVEHPSLTHKKG